jgi:hypothetical protein
MIKNLRYGSYSTKLKLIKNLLNTKRQLRKHYVLAGSIPLSKELMMRNIFKNIHPGRLIVIGLPRIR